MTENESKPEMSPLETVERNLKTALNAWTAEINVSELPKALQRKHRVVSDKTAALMYDVHQYITTERRVGRPAGSLTKTTVRNELKNATPEQLAAIAKILGQKPEPETDVSPVSADVENFEEVNENE
ncbi:MAG: hypothetical protein PHR29_05960 [Acholeplasmataceae bacterium]|nr:hypothetical protein [Acholeplasmataceae bacterium]